MKISGIVIVMVVKSMSFFKYLFQWRTLDVEGRSIILKKITVETITDNENLGQIVL